jgi:hypothetical protein
MILIIILKIIITIFIKNDINFLKLDLSLIYMVYIHVVFFMFILCRNIWGWPGLRLRPARLNLFWAKSVFDKTHLYALFFYFSPLLFWYLVKHAFSNIKKIWKNLWTFLNLFIGPSRFSSISPYNWFVNFYCEKQIQCTTHYF